MYYLCIYHVKININIEASRGAGQRAQCVLWVRYPLDEMKYLIFLFVWSSLVTMGLLSFATQYAMSPELSR